MRENKLLEKLNEYQTLYFQELVGNIMPFWENYLICSGYREFITYPSIE